MHYTDTCIRNKEKIVVNVCLVFQSLFGMLGESAYKHTKHIDCYTVML